MLLLATLLYIIPGFLCFNSTQTGIPNEDDPSELLYRELSIDGYFSLPFHDPEDTAVSFRRSYASMYADPANLHDTLTMKKEDYDWAVQYSPPAHQGSGKAAVSNLYSPYINYKDMNPEAYTISQLCYAVSYLWRRGRKGMQRHQSFRDIYYNHMPFEIGYITQTIMAKYQTVLELYEFTVRLEPQRKIGRPHIFFFYRNILETCRTIIHLCNMIHEVTRKYRLQQYSARFAKWIKVPHDPSAKFQDFVPGHYGAGERGIEGHEHEKAKHEDPAIFELIKKAGLLEKQEKERQYQAVKPQKDYFLDHGAFSMTSSTTRRSKRWRSNDPMIYGWEPEDM